jgi:CubicO group peptidase (beta-lactamase class C family)
MTGPESDVRVAVVDAAHGKDADAAVAAAWATVFPDAKRPLKLTQPRPARRGWDEQRAYSYETSPNEKLVVAAQALRHGEAWTVVLLASSEPAYERRLSQIALVFDTLHPKGYAKESFAGKKAHALDAARVRAVTEMLDQAKDALGVPGVALSLVQDGKVVFEGGLGVRELGKPAKVDADTLFMIASNTKALTTLLLAKLVDEKKMTWETPVTDVYPAFKLGDAETTRQVLVKHLVCACTGLPRQDLEFLFEFKGQTANSKMDLLGTFKPTTKFGETFQYSNLLAAAAGYVAAASMYPKKELGAAYDEAMREAVFGPLGMKDTTFDFAATLRKNHATPHGPDLDGKPAIAGMDINYSVVSVRPAGGAWSNVKDLTHYVQMELAKGQLPGGKRLVSETNLLERRAPQVSIGENTTYGMGLEVDREYGVPVVHHGGSLIGFKSDMFWLPEQGIGGVILTNSDRGGLMLRPFVRKVLEVAFDGKPEAAEDLASSGKRVEAARAAERKRLVVPPAPEAVAKLAKHYTNASLGDITQREDGARRVFDFGEWKSAIASRQNDDGTTSMVTIDPGVDDFEFVVAERDHKRALVTRDAQHEYVFLEAE